MTISRARKYQILWRSQGRCVDCGADAMGKARCEKHAKKHMECVRMWRITNRSKGLCEVCLQPCVDNRFCAKHRTAAAEAQLRYRRRHGKS